GHILDFITIDVVNGEKEGYNIFEMPFSTNVQENHVFYSGLLQNSSGQPIGTINITYSFYKDTICRESDISNDWSDHSSGMLISATTRFFCPIVNFILSSDGKRIEKRVYPSEDGSSLDDKFYGIFLQNEHSGMYVEHLPTSPYPSDLFYSGSVRYSNYCLLQFKQESWRSISPGASFKSVQYISIGDEVTAKRRVEEQRSIELHPYPDGIIPMVVTEDISRTTRYDLPTIKLYADIGVSYMITDRISAPYLGVLWDEGFRHPQMAYYHGSATDLVMLPASNPQSASLSGKDPENLFKSWRSVIDSVAQNHDMALFVFRIADVENPEYAGKFDDLYDYARKNGLTTTTPEDIADHYRKLQKISYTASKELGRASINVTNSNLESISGVTFRVVMPQLEEGRYLVKGGKVANTRESGDSIIIYASVHLAPQETRTITIEPDVPKKELIIGIPEYIIENKVSISVRGEDGRPISNALVSIEGFPIPFETDADGIAQAELSRGTYKVSVEKAGYSKQTFKMEVRGRIYALHHLIYDIL
ncbi:carboxypeptidase-like regulatory domain-containing protein, partial [Methanocalculus sp.]|uniref:carboxypeptidase-like regulatory domain-containing protein n=1 Tax=Methanocalculus sp. TaxID=2004547 RepID=UPI00262C4241